MDRERRPDARTRVLVVEDGRIASRVTVQLLQVIGVEADTASDGHQAVAATTRREYDLVLMDVRMPGMDGLEATRHICAQRRNELPRVVGLTSYDDPEHVAACLEAGMDDCLFKPLSIPALEACLRRIVRAGDLVDLQVLAGMAESIGSVGAAEAVTMYIEDAPKLAARVDEAAVASNAHAVRRAAHQLKSSSLVVGANAVSVACRRLEDTAEAGAIELLPPQAARLHAALGPALRILAAERDRLTEWDVMATGRHDQACGRWEGV